MEDTVCLELIRCKDGSIVSISKISEVIAFIVDAVKLYNNSFERQNVTFQGVKTYSDSYYIFPGGQDPQTLRIYAPD